jgi:hypothetical protein
MNRACNTLRGRLNLLVLAFLLTPTFSTRHAVAQDAAAQAAQMASDAAMQTTQMMQTQMATQQAMQQAMQQSMQDAQTLTDMNNAAAAYSSSTAQRPAALPSPNTPVPPQIRTAHTIFLANDGSAPNFPIDPNVAYEAVYNALQGWGHYVFAPTAQQADLIFQLRGVDPITDVSGGRGGVYSSTSPAFQLVIRDPKTNTRLWTVTSPVVMAGRSSSREHWENVDITNLVSRVKVLAGQVLSPEETASLTSYPKEHSLRTGLIVSGLLAGAAVGGAIALHAAYSNSLASQKASQDAFCEAAHIPLSECAGG